MIAALLCVAAIVAGTCAIVAYAACARSGQIDNQEN